MRGASENLSVLEKSVKPFFVVLIFFLFSVSLDFSIIIIFPPYLVTVS